jgi:hypothetical protein
MPEIAGWTSGKLDSPHLHARQRRLLAGLHQLVVNMRRRLITFPPSSSFELSVLGSKDYISQASSVVDGQSRSGTIKHFSLSLTLSRMSILLERHKNATTRTAKAECNSGLNICILLQNWG